MNPEKYMSLLLAGLMLIGVTPYVLSAQTIGKPGPKDTCPVCGMFVSLYPDWTAAVASEDGTTFFFDGSKDMFKFILNPAKWAPHIENKPLVVFQVTDYYTLEAMDARTAFYVIGSEVTGPMGHEMIPLRTRDDALEFMADHKGIKLIRFDEVTPAVLEGLDAGIFNE